MEEQPNVESSQYYHAIITYIAGLLSVNEDIKDFIIDKQILEMSLTKNIFVKLWFQNELVPHAYSIQIANIDVKYDYLMKYKEIMYTIMNNKHKHEFLNDVPNENFQFWIYSTAFVSNNHNLLQCLENNAKCMLKPLFDISTCYKIMWANECQSKDLFNQLYLCLNQQYEDVLNNLRSIYKDFSEQMICDILKYIKEYLTINTRFTKNIFDTELLRIYLRDIIVKPTFASNMNLEGAQILNKLILGQDITIIENKHGIEANIFGCLNQQIKDTFNSDFEWNELIENTGDLNVSSYLNELFKDSLQYLLVNLDASENLFLEMWKLNYVPLVLKPNNSNFVSILQQYKYLKKKFIVIGDVRVIHDVKSFCSSVFTNMNDIQDIEARNKLFNTIVVSFQGRKPVTLYDTIDNNQNCMNALTCYEILHLIRKRTKIYINKSYISKIKEIVFIISDNSIPSGFHMNMLTVNNNNAIVKCNPNSISEYIQWIKTSSFRDDPIVYLKKKNVDILEVSSGDFKKIKQYLVDSEGSSIYVTEDNQVIPLLGKNCTCNLEEYIEGSFRKAFLDEEVFFRERRRVFFICGDIDSYKSFIRAEMSNFCENSHYYIDNNLSMPYKSSYFEIKDGQSIEDCWAKLKNRDCQLFHINVTKGNLELLKVNNCNTLTKHILYSDEIFSEKDFFKEITQGITVICGETGIGKSCMLNSLLQNYNAKDFVLFCNLTDFYDDLLCRNEQLLEKPLDFIFNKYTNLSVFVHSVYEYHKATDRLILFLDGIDEVLPICEEIIFKFLKTLVESKVQVVTTSRFNTDNMLINTLNFRPVRIVNFTDNKARQFLQQQNVSNINMQNIPVALQENPLNLQLLSMIDGNMCILDVKLMSKLRLYEEIVHQKVNDYGANRIIKQNINIEEFSKIHKVMALITIFGTKMVLNQGLVKNFNELLNKFENLNCESYFIKKFNGNFPIFKHQIFAEFFAMQWVIENLNEKNSSVIFYKRIMNNAYRNVRYLFDSIVCKDLALHKAVLQENLDLVKNLLRDDKTTLIEVDKCGRTALLLASTYCTKEKNFKILEEILQVMVKKGCYLYSRDKYMKWNWIKSFGTFYTGDFFHKACKYGLTTALKLYLDYYNIESETNHIVIARDWHALNIVLMLLQRNPALLPQYYEYVLRDGIDHAQLNIVYEFVRLYSNNSLLYNKKFVCFDKLCRNKYKKIIPKYIKKCLTLKMKFKFTALHLACIYGNAKLVNELVKLDADLYAVDKYGNFPLHYATIKQSLEIVNILAQHMPDINVSNQRNATALHLACKYTNLEIIHALIEKGIDINQQDCAEYTALMYACIDGKTEIVQTLLDYGANIMPRTFGGDMALHLACDYGHLEIVKLLLKQTMDLLFAANNENRTPITVASLYRRYNVIKYLLSIQPDGFKFILREKLDYFSGYREIKKLLEKNLLKKEHLEYPLIDGQTPLHIAAKSNFEDTVSFLIEREVQLNPRDDYGYTPLHFITSKKVLQPFIMKYNQNEKEINLHTHKVKISKIHTPNLVKMTLCTSKNDFYSQITDMTNIKFLLKHCSEINGAKEYPLCSVHLKVYGHDLSLLETILDNESSLNLKLTETKMFGNTTMKYLNGEFIRIISIESENRRVDVIYIEATIDKIEYLLTNNLIGLKFELSVSNLFKLIEKKELDPVKVLFKEHFINKYDLQCSDESSQRPLHYAAQRGFTEIIRFLLEAGVKLNSHDKNNETPLHKITFEKDIKLFIEEYKKANLDLNEQSNYGYTILHRACQRGMYKAVKELLAANVSTSCRDNSGNMPIYYAKRSNIVKLLKDVTSDENFH